MKWQVQEAKQRLSEVIRRALSEGPQIVAKHGKEVAVVVSAQEYRALVGAPQDFKIFLLSAPDLAALNISRARDLGRSIHLG